MQWDSLKGRANLLYALTYVKVETLIFKYVFKNNVKSVYLLLPDLIYVFKIGANFVILASFNFIYIIYGLFQGHIQTPPF